MKFHVRRDDRVMVIAGKERGKIGKILKVFPKKQLVIVEKVNVVKRHARPSPTTGKGGIIEKEAPIHISNVMIMCDKCMKPVRVGHKFLEDGRKVRYCKKCGEIIDKV
ncbi:MAG: 50S ribosomal protein L24 [Deltaproteobacteria bacterium]|nr:50S ribosomal protein L24 [Deltaproteobacteria bacterium]